MTYDEEVKVLLHSFAEISILDSKRKSRRMTLPDENLIVKFNIVAKEIMCKLSRTYETQKRGVITFFGAPIIVIAKLWELLLENNDGNAKIISNKEHLY